jgi:hypothetical protein
MKQISESLKSYYASPYRSIKHNTYFDTYDELFSRYRNKDITFVEIGVLGGGSLFMWKDFLGDGAKIIGIDLNPEAMKLRQFGFDIYIGSQSDQKFWEEFLNDVGPIDVVLDDGGHTYEQQIVTTEMLLHNIRDNGMLVVEDIHTSYMEGFGPRRYSFINYVKDMIDNINRRFSAFDGGGAERRVWSIQIFESIVAFHINRKASEIRSEPTDNGGINNQAVDHRGKDNERLNLVKNYIKYFQFLKCLPGLHLLKILILNKVSINPENRHLLNKIFKKR